MANAQHVSQPPIWNPHTGNLDFVGPGNGLLLGDTYYLFNNGTDNAYYTYDGTNLCLFLNSVSNTCYASAINYLLLESGSYLLLENSGRITLE